MKKIFLFLILLLCLFLIACGGGGGSDNPSGGGNGGNGGGNGGGNSAPAHPWLCFTALTAGSSISTTNQGGTVTNTPSLEYSYDGENWEPFILNTGDDATNTTVPLANAGDKVYLRATGTNDSFSESGKYIKFTMEGSIAASGNIMSLLDKDCTSTTIPCNSCFSHLFFGCSALKTAPDLPAMTLASHCYSSMFYNCSSLTEPPVLSATTLADSCYLDMFSQCYSLQTTPVLPAITLADSCYSGMFYKCTNLTMAHDLPATTLAYGCCCDMFRNCTSLETAPALPATTLANSCYEGMFRECSSLTTAPALPAISLANSCYKVMFFGCTSLSSITVNFTTWDNAYTEDWVVGVPSGGTFTCPNDLPRDYPTDFGDSRIPTGWGIQHPTP